MPGSDDSNDTNDSYAQGLSEPHSKDDACTQLTLEV